MIKQVDVPIDNQFHEYTVGAILHVDFKKNNFVSFWHENSQGPFTKWMRVYDTNQVVPPDVVYVGSALDQRGQGEIHHLHWTDYAGAHPGTTPPTGERPHSLSGGLG